MAQDVVINGTTYPAVESVALTDGNGTVTQYYPDAVRYVAQTLDEAQKDQARENIGAISLTELNEELTKRGQLAPEFAESEEWLAENGDTSKMYVLPDGFIYAYQLKTGPAYINLLTTAVDVDGTPYNGGKGYKTGYRFSTTNGIEKADSKYCCTGFIRVNSGQIVRVKNITKASAGSGSVIWFKSDRIGDNRILPPIYESEFDGYLANGIYAFTAPTNSALYYFTLSTGKIDDNTIITVDEEITGSSGSANYAWVNTGHAFVPADYDDEIANLKQTTNVHTGEISNLKDRVSNLEDGVSNLTDAEKLAKIKNWDKPVYDYSPVTLLPTERTKPALTASDRTVDAVYAKYRALMAKHPRYITETNLGKSTASDTFTAVDILRFDFKEPDGLVQSSSYTVNETKPKIILMCGVHCEYAGIYGVYYALEEIAENPEFDDIRRNAHIIVVPCSNPFGLTSQAQIDGWQMSHVNANGVAIHNNFGVEHNTYNADAVVGEFNYGGTEPYSELETQYMDNLMAENSDAIAFVTCHNFNNDVVFGSMAIWASSATAYMCNLAFRLIDKISKAWHSKYGSSLQEAIDTYKTDALPEGETRLGYAQFSTSAGTEQLNATKYGIQATNLEISDNMRVFTDAQFSADVMTRGAEVYANFFRTILAAYDHNDKKLYGA